MFLMDDIIVAISSAGGSGERGVIRLSGNGALGCAGAVFQAQGYESLAEVPAWSCVRGRCRLDEVGEEEGQDQIRKPVVDCAAAAYVFRLPHSYTTQEMVELHLPGAPVLLQMVLESLLTAGALAAEPGEFTARAFLNGRIDLTEAEAVAAVINSRSDAQLRAAENLLDGQLHRLTAGLVNRLTDVLALVEVDIDFSEEDIEIAPSGQLREMIDPAAADLERLIAGSITWDELYHVPRVAVAGPANAGKSSLVNRLLGMDRSIVSAIAGTTRDQLTAPLPLPHGECLLIDTAGLGAVDDPLAEEAHRLTHRAIETCDLLLWIYDITTTNPQEQAPPTNLKIPTSVLTAANKIDLQIESIPQPQPVNPHNQSRSPLSPASDKPSVAISALRGDNLENLVHALDRELFHDLSAEGASQRLALTARQRRALLTARGHLHQARELLAESEPIVASELLALEIRLVLDSLGQISGEVVTEDVLGRIFSQFCIGK